MSSLLSSWEIKLNMPEMQYRMSKNGKKLKRYRQGRQMEKSNNYLVRASNRE
jgi:hypothetical protein